MISSPVPKVPRVLQPSSRCHCLPSKTNLQPPAIFKKIKVDKLTVKENRNIVLFPFSETGGVPTSVFTCFMIPFVRQDRYFVATHNMRNEIEQPIINGCPVKHRLSILLILNLHFSHVPSFIDIGSYAQY